MTPSRTMATLSDVKTTVDTAVNELVERRLSGSSCALTSETKTHFNQKPYQFIN